MPLVIEVLSSPGCAKCIQARERLRRLVTDDFPHSVQWREVNIMEALDYAVKLGVLSTPAIVIDGNLEFKSLPSMDKLRDFIQQKLKAREQA